MSVRTDEMDGAKEKNERELKKRGEEVDLGFKGFCERESGEERAWGLRRGRRALEEREMMID